MPSNLKGSLFFAAPVKRLRLLRRGASKDLADRYLPNVAEEPIDIEVSLSARRSRNFGPLNKLLKKMPKQLDGIIAEEKVEFTEAIAEIKFGGRTRRVGVFGTHGDAGVIDITENIVMGLDGHPTFASLERETEMLLKDFYKALIARLR